MNSPTKCEGVNEQRSDAIYTPETGYMIVVAKRNLSNATKRLNRHKVALHNLAETIKAAGGDILPYVTRVTAIQRDINSARQAIYRWERKLLSLGIDIYKVD